MPLPGPLTTHPGPARAAGQDRLKRLVDIVGAALLLLVTAPLMAVVAVLVVGRLGRPVFFRQCRAGRHAAPFEVVKFRSMLPPAPDQSQGLRLAHDGDRLTPFGRWLRATSLDELPTLWNVLRGEMSLVGPRPLPIEYLGRYSPVQARRHEVRPGVTGLAQVSGRNSLTWEQKLALDVRYVDHRSLWLDLSILAATVRTVLSREGISAPGLPTAPEFLGTAQPTAPQQQTAPPQRDRSPA